MLSVIIGVTGDINAASRQPNGIIMTNLKVWTNQLRFKVLLLAVLGLGVGIAIIFVQYSDFVYWHLKFGQDSAHYKRDKYILQISGGPCVLSNGTYQNALALGDYAKILRILEAELEHVPFLVCCALVGPALMIFRRGKQAVSKPTLRVKKIESQSCLSLEKVVEHGDISTAQIISLEPIKEQKLKE